MTTIAISAYACRFCDAVASSFKNVYKKIVFGMQMSANQRVAKELVHLGFHQQKEMSQILQRMNDAAIEEHYGKK
ncbi:MAG: hypothetical protein HKN86_00965 [Acidimicrobiia bacterium]|nr:hypothetical protein [Acidimicrobiia bacterium]